MESQGPSDPWLSLNWKRGSFLGYLKQANLNPKLQKNLRNDWRVLVEPFEKFKLEERTLLGQSQTSQVELKPKKKEMSEIHEDV